MDVRLVAPSPTVIEFIGLPGAGKTTIANHLAYALRECGYEVRTTSDFVRWLSEQSRGRKIGFMLSEPHRALRQVFWCALFGLSLLPPRAISIAKIIRVPYINLCFDRYLDTLDNVIVVMDQANMQLIWSIGAFSTQHKRSLLHRACKATTGIHPRRFVSLTPDVAETSERLLARDTDHSRFDDLQGVQLNRTLNSASRIIEDIRAALCQEGQAITDIDASLPPERNAHHLLVQIRQTLSTK